MKKTWTEISAREALKSYITGEKIINFKGKGTLRQCSAADFLVSKHGYLVSSEVAKGEK